MNILQNIIKIIYIIHINNQSNKYIMKRVTENSNDDISKRNKSDLNIEENIKDNVLNVNQKKSFKTKDEELRNVSDIIEDAFNNGITKVLFDLESGAFANHESFSEKSLDVLMNKEKKRIDDLIDQFVKEKTNEEWLYFSVSNRLTTERRNKIFDELKNDGWQAEHWVIAPCVDYMADNYWGEGWNDKSQVKAAGVTFPMHTNNHRMKK